MFLNLNKKDITGGLDQPRQPQPSFTLLLFFTNQRILFKIVKDTHNKLKSQLNEQGKIPHTGDTESLDILDISTYTKNSGVTNMEILLKSKFIYNIK